ncbi:MAG: integrase [Hyphomicrobiales bacterium]|nr:integrase [Hyphomicrobiales bacterium]
MALGALRMAAQINRLSARAVQTLAKPGRHADGGNLYLNVTKTGARSWVFFYKVAGRQREMGLGTARDISLAKARELAAACRQLLADGKDPLTCRDAPDALTFGQCADQFIETMEPSWRNEKHRAQWRMTLKEYAGPLRATGVDAIATDDVLKVLKPIWLTKPETASRVRGRIEAVLDWARAREMRKGENPARWRGHLDHLLPKRTTLSRGHHAALAIDDLPKFMEKLAASTGISPRALGFAILTAARSGEVLAATWDEIDFAKKVWTVPAVRMKAGREHRVPLSEPALAILQSLHDVRIGQFIFPGQIRTKHLSSMSLAMTLRRMQVEVTVHGFRSTFRDWASERTSFPHETCEMALAHAVSNKVEAAYRRGDLFEKRVSLMHAWGQFCTSGAAKDNVVTLAGRSAS